MVRQSSFAVLALAALGSLGFSHTAAADSYADTIKLFQNAGESGSFFEKSYGYAVFPTVGKGGLGIGGARGQGRVYERGRYVGNIKLTQVSIGFQAGGQAFSQIIFLQDKRAFDELTSGEFAFGAGVGAVAFTAGANDNASAVGLVLTLAETVVGAFRGVELSSPFPIRFFPPPTVSGALDIEAATVTRVVRVPFQADYTI
jgi:lipid-binding SYLF domain-containing protein